MEARSANGGVTVAVESYGVRLDIRVGDPSLVPALAPILPPGWREADDSPADVELALERDAEARFSVLFDSELVTAPVDLDVALVVLEERIRGTVAVRAPNLVFVHAGVVAVDGRGLVLPAASFAGKTTLVAALVRAGATYYSDEFAVLDHEARVHPYPKPLSIRGRRGEPVTEVRASDLGGATGDESVPVSLVALTGYVPGAEWDPRLVEPGEAALGLLAHAVPARKRPAEALRAVRAVAASCACVRSDRGEADPAAEALLALLAERPVRT